MFFLDFVLACLPMLNAQRVHGLWAAIAVFLLVFWILRVADRHSVSRGWKWQRYGVKALILVIAEGVVLLSRIEQCDLNQTTCHRLFF